MPFLGQSGLSQSPEPLKGKVLLTGGSGFIASHILDYLLDDGFEVVVTTRTEEKGRTIVKTLKHASHRCSYAVVPDISREGAFDAVFQAADKPFEYVVHTASPYHMNVQDPVKDFLDPAIKGTTGILTSIKAHASSVRRVVITSSSAAILNPKSHAKVYDETHWAPVTWDDAMDPMSTYRCSKVFSERAAWTFVETEAPEFDLVVINPTYNFGPIQRGLPGLDAMNTSNHRVRDMVLGRMRDGLEPTAPVFTWVDVRDVALAHLRAIQRPEAGGNRFYLVGGHFSNKRIADIIVRACPHLRDGLPPMDQTEDDFPADVYQFDNNKSKQMLGIEYTSLEKSVVDTVSSILEHMD